ncbi:MAG: hypothetical protein GY856_21335 [bacterium]|nr:hypothetical protein [bacterium]
MVRAIPALIIPRQRAAWLDELLRGVDLMPKLVALVAVMAAGASIYGAVIGMWRGGQQVIWAAIKLPLVLITTSALTMVFNWMAAVLWGLRVRFVQVAALTFLALAIAAVVLASLVPVAWLFTVSAPEVSLYERTTHNLLYLLHTLLVAVSGLVGTVTLWRALEYCSRDRRQVRRIYWTWLVTFAVVGGEVAWALRPFVGSIYYPVAFLRDDALDGNVYEFILRDIVPYLLSALANGGN